MIIVTVKASPKSEHKQDFLNSFNAVSETVYQEDGCLEYEIYQKDEVSSDVFLFERWESQAALDAHLATPHMKEFFEKVSPWFEVENDMQTYEVK
ncbi:MAG: antibiotic biosynthesis monooxygenase [Carboxylicivirga sp.]|jgi:quinol monooxygenase YgiN|nr:antibiotic biosynthesis monooxygenase [Carboxylicivirga sp.]MCT4624223.1 antibiotic biosynthesis monooxygenase [Schleiferiaceae bacterium]